MSTECPLLTVLDTWFETALDTITDPAVRRDVLLLVGGAARLDEVVTVTRDDCTVAGDHLFVYPPDGGGRSLPLTPTFLDAVELGPDEWPDERLDPDADAEAVRRALDGIDPRLDAEALRLLRMHAWRHELGTGVEVLERCYGDELTDLLAQCGDCPTTRHHGRDTEDLIPMPRGGERIPV